MTTPSGDVRAAFTILLDEIDAAVEAINRENIAAISARSYDKVKFLAERAQTVEQFRERVHQLQKDWQSLLQGIARPRARVVARTASAGAEQGPGRGGGTRRQGPKLARGVRTPESAYRVPILRALVEKGGSAPAGELMPLIYEQVKELLNADDYDSPPSAPNVPRWKNTAQWARAKLVEEGLMRDDSSFGIWEISDDGRHWLAEKGGGLTAPAIDATPAPQVDGWEEIERGLDETPQVLSNVLMVFRLVHSRGLGYNEAVRALSERRGHATVNTIADSCTRRIGLTAGKFREIVQRPSALYRHLAHIFPQFDAFLNEMLIDSL